MSRTGRILVVCLALVCALPWASAGRDIEIREYTVPYVGEGSPPTIDGVYSEDEWAAAGPWTGEFVGLNNGANDPAWQGEEVPLEYRWRAVWDDDYLYMVMEGEIFEFAYNGDPAYVEDDDMVYSYSTGVGVDYEIFLEPNWQEGDGFNSDPPAFTDPGGDGINDGYHLIWFVLEGDEDLGGLANEGVRGADNPYGPQFFSTSAEYNTTYLGGEWNPTFDPAFAQEWDAEPMLGGTSLNRVENPGAGDPVARPIMEVAFAFSQMNNEWELAESDDPEETNIVLVKDADGNYVHEGDEWLINMSAYTDPYSSAEGYPLITWNNCLGSAFASYPRGLLIFGGAGTGVVDWMLR